MSTPTASEAHQHRATLIWYGFVVFLSSAILLVLEIVAGRLIAPYVGVSIYSWTSIIGVILAGLSLGNWLGGHWVQKGAGELAVGIVLLLAAIASIGSLLALTLIAPLLQGSRLDLISSSFLYILSMFFIPAVLIGIVTPVLTTLGLGLDSRSGFVVGRMHALAALGSIVGTFATGYWLIQYFGTRSVVLGSATCLLLLALPFLRRLRRGPGSALTLALVLMLAVTDARDGFANPCQRESNYFCLRVVDMSDPAYGSAKALILDHLLHGINHRQEPALLISPYVHAMDELVRTHFGERDGSGLRYFFAGGGAYTQPRSVLTMRPGAAVTVAELDPQVTAVAREELFVETGAMKVIHRDARTVLQQVGQKYDIIVTDVFHDISVPYHMVTREFAATVNAALSEEGLYLVNIVDAFPDARLVKSLVMTLEQEFAHVDIWLDELPEQEGRVTYVVSAHNGPPLPEIIVSSQGFERQWLRINTPMFETGTAREELSVLSDDYVPVERLLSGLLFSDKGL